MPDFKINAQERTITGRKVSQLRAQGLVPIVMYGPKTPSMQLQVSYGDLERTLRDAGGTNLIELNVNGDTYQVLAREVQRDVIKREILHADFFALDPSSKITVDVPVVMLNESPAVAAREGILLTGPNALSVEMRASNMINQIEVDLSSLAELGDSIYVKDLDVGENVNILNDPDEMIARVSQTSADRREEALAALDGEEGEALLEGEEGEEGEMVEGEEEEEFAEEE